MVTFHMTLTAELHINTNAKFCVIITYVGITADSCTIMTRLIAATFKVKQFITLALQYI